LEIKYQQLLNDSQIKHKFEVITTSKPGEAIVRRARELTADMIVMGSRGHGVMGRALFGSVSDYVLHHSHVPVVIHRQQQEQHQRH
jgi:nucleotide-binding universal stress UspA family protein